MQTQIPEWLLELIDNQRVTDILLSSATCQIDFGEGLSSQQDHLLTEPELQLLARELIELGGRRLDHANPFADVSLPGGLRVHAALRSGCSEQTQISIRLHNSKVKNLDQLLQEPFVTRSQRNQILQIVELSVSRSLLRPAWKLSGLCLLHELDREQANYRGVQCQKVTS